MILQESPKVRTGIAFMVMLLGVVTILVAMQLFDENIVKFMLVHPKIFTNISGYTAYEYGVLSLLTCIAGGGLTVGAGFVGVFGSLVKSKWLYLLFILLSLAASSIMIVSPLLFLNTLPMMSSYTGEDEDLYYVGNPNDADFNLDEIQHALLDYNIGIFNECCVEPGFNAQSYMLACTGDNDVDCPVIEDERIDQFLDPSILCTCATSQTKIDQYRAAVKENDLCNIMGNIHIDATTLKIPTVGVDLYLAISSLYSSATLDEIPLIGFHEDPSVYTDPQFFPDATDEPDNGFGCGIGFVKGVMWFTFVWYEETLKPIAINGIALGCVQFGLLIIALLIHYLQSHDDQYVGQVEDRPAEFAITTMHQPLPADKQAQMNSMISQNTQQMGQQQQPVSKFTIPGDNNNNNNAMKTDPASNSDVQVSVVDEKAREEVRTKLLAFYNKYEPDKSMADVEDIADWAATNGIDQLNKKLKSKYNDDLSTIQNESKLGIAKVLSDDVDI